MYNIATKPRCPKCSYSRYWKLRRNKYKCQRCRREYSARSYINGVTASRCDWQRCIEVFLKQRTVRAVAVETGASYAKTQKMLYLLRQVMLADEPPAFSGICEADETFVGGQWRNKRRPQRAKGTKRGQGTHKIPTVAVYSRDLGQVRVRVIEGRTGPLYWQFILSCLTSQAVLYTDGLQMNRGLAKRFNLRHEYVDHEAGEFVRGSVHTNSVEGFWGCLKRSLASVGGVRQERLPLFVGEFAWRYNYRKLTHTEQVARLLELLNDPKFGGKI